MAASERSERVKYFSTREDKFGIYKRPCNLYIYIYIYIDSLSLR